MFGEMHVDSYTDENEYVQYFEEGQEDLQNEEEDEDDERQRQNPSTLNWGRDTVDFSEIRNFEFLPSNHFILTDPPVTGTRTREEQVDRLTDFDEHSVNSYPAVPPEVGLKNIGNREMTTEQLRERFMHIVRDDPGFLRRKIPILSGSPAGESRSRSLTRPRPCLRQYPELQYTQITQKVSSIEAFQSCCNAENAFHLISLLLFAILILTGELFQFPGLIIKMATTGFLCLSSIFAYTLFQEWSTSGQKNEKRKTMFGDWLQPPTEPPVQKLMEDNGGFCSS
jgi:hypothetical protein